MIRKALPLFLLALLVGLTACRSKPAPEEIVSNNPIVREKALEKLGKLPDKDRQELVAPLIQKLKAEDGQVAQRAFDGLALIGAPAIPTLVSALKDDNAYVRMSSADLLGRISPAADVVAPLTETLKDVHPLVREEAAIALGNLGALAQDALPQLQIALKDTDSNVRSAAQEALTKISPEISSKKTS